MKFKFFSFWKIFIRLLNNFLNLIDRSGWLIDGSYKSSFLHFIIRNVTHFHVNLQFRIIHPKEKGIFLSKRVLFNIDSFIWLLLLECEKCQHWNKRQIFFLVIYFLDEICQIIKWETFKHNSEHNVNISTTTLPPFIFFIQGIPAVWKTEFQLFVCFDSC